MARCWLPTWLPAERVPSAVDVRLWSADVVLWVVEASPRACCSVSASLRSLLPGAVARLILTPWRPVPPLVVRTRYQARPGRSAVVVADLEELHGPVEGVVRLPLWPYWSGENPGHNLAVPLFRWWRQKLGCGRRESPAGIWPGTCWLRVAYSYTRCRGSGRHRKRCSWRCSPRRPRADARQRAARPGADARLTHMPELRTLHLYMLMRRTA